MNEEGAAPARAAPFRFDSTDRRFIASRARIANRLRSAVSLRQQRSANREPTQNLRSRATGADGGPLNASFL